MFTKKDKNIPALQIKTNGSPRDEIALLLINQFTFLELELILLAVKT